MAPFRSLSRQRPKAPKCPTWSANIEEAEKNLATARLRPYRVEGYNPDVGVNMVASQVPSAGVELQPGSVVALAVSQGPAPAQIRVPKLIGLKEEDAKTLLGVRRHRRRCLPVLQR